MIAEPYKVLEVSKDASDDDVKKAYRALCKRYHPDANPQDPDAAEKKFKDVQEAYQQVMYAREHGMSADGYEYGGAGTQGGFGGYGGFGSYGDFWEAWRNAGGGAYGRTSSGASGRTESNEMKAAANYINAGHYQEALYALNQMTERSARWYYYSAAANSGLGNNVTAKEHAEKAVELDPNNIEYLNFLQQLEYGGTAYQSRGAGYGRGGMMSGRCCAEFCVINLLCNCCARGGC